MSWRRTTGMLCYDRYVTVRELVSPFFPQILKLLHPTFTRPAEDLMCNELNSFDVALIAHVPNHPTMPLGSFL